jgi:hypothetical protein
MEGVVPEEDLAVLRDNVRLGFTLVSGSDPARESSQLNLATGGKTRRVGEGGVRCHRSHDEALLRIGLDDDSILRELLLDKDDLIKGGWN